ncbi:hypothetical protein HMPREF0496_0026 [Lentilactobacillus hilgardii ATCC 27305]|nr:hypothetical protein HMPREF0496_0026 [Lentilactobacillus hilgardii ATCC 27305]
MIVQLIGSISSFKDKKRPRTELTVLGLKTNSARFLRACKIAPAD